MFGDLSNESKNPPENLHISGINSVRERPILRHSSGETRMIAKSAVVTSSYCTTFNRTVVMTNNKFSCLLARAICHLSLAISHLSLKGRYLMMLALQVFLCLLVPEVVWG